MTQSIHSESALTPQEAIPVNDTPSTVHSGLRHLLGRRRFLALGGGAAALAVGGASAAKALISASGTNATPRSAQPLGNDPVAGREPTSVNPPVGGVRYYVLAGTDGWYTLPSATVTGNAATGSEIGRAHV